MKAEVVDHIVPHRGDGKLFWDEGNWLESLGFHIGDRLQVDYEEGSIHIHPAPPESECPAEPA